MLFMSRIPKVSNQHTLDFAKFKSTGASEWFTSTSNSGESDESMQAEKMVRMGKKSLNRLIIPSNLHQSYNMTY